MAATAQAVSSRRSPWLAVVALGLLAVAALPIAVLRRVITLCLLVALAAAVGVLPLAVEPQLRRDS